MGSESGRGLSEVFEFLAVVLLVPPIFCCALQVLVAIVGIVLPWVLLFGVALVVAGGIGAGFAARRRVLPPGGGIAARVPPVRRPPGIADRRHYQD
jgi:hypothetical protein